MGSNLERADLIKMIGGGITLMIEFATLVKVLRGSKHKLASRVLVMLMATNAIILADGVAYLKMPEKYKLKIKEKYHYSPWFYCFYDTNCPT